MRADLTARLVARVVHRLLAGVSANGPDTVVPDLQQVPTPATPLFDMDSGYLRRGAHLMPRSGPAYPWTMRQNVVLDSWHTRRASLRELRWSRASTAFPTKDTKDTETPGRRA